LCWAFSGTSNGTLEKGFEFLQGLGDPFHRAVFMMFLVSEVHPSVDGNGRVARVMMNAELVACDQERIIIPTAYRADYMSALKSDLAKWPHRSDHPDARRRPALCAFDRLEHA
jgi:fido (protein-threonine AMPylation protein)